MNSLIRLACLSSIVVPVASTSTLQSNDQLESDDCDNQLPLEEVSLVQTRHDLMVAAKSAVAKAPEPPLASGKSQDSAQPHIQLSKKLDEVPLSRDLQRIVWKLWHGIDTTETENEEVAKVLRSSDGGRFPQLVASPGSTSKRIHLLGPPDSGTHLLVQSLQLNWGDLARQACGDPNICDVSLWKHSIGVANDLYDHMQRCQDPSCATQLEKNMSNAVVIIMVRSPISQLASWKKAPYSLKPCMDRPWDEMTSSCWSNTSPSCHDVIEGCEEEKYSEKSLHFQSSVDVYNRYIEEYLELQRDGRIGNVVILPYEDLVLTPDLAMTRVAEAMGWDSPDSFKIISADAKEDGGSRDRDEALEVMQSRAWLDEIGTENLRSICRLLNTSALEGFSEGTDTPDSVPYMRDCENAFAFEHAITDTIAGKL